MDINIFGLNFKTSSITVRELLALNEKEIKNILDKIILNNNILECLILSTCNRFEIYTVTKNGFDATDYLTAFLSSEKEYNFNKVLNDIYILKDKKVVNHLFKVAGGLDSMILGEPQIAGQIKKAYSIACHKKSNGILLNKLFHSAFRISKRIRNETKINRGAGSVGFVAIELARSIFKDLSTCSVLLIGAGKIANITAKNLFERKIKKFFIANRTYKRACELSDNLEGIPIEFEKIDNYINKSDLIISTTGSKDYIITKNQMENILKKRTRGPLLIIDIAMPRDFDPEIANFKNINLINIDGLKNVINNNINNRKSEIPKALNIINEETEIFIKWKSTIKINPIMKSISDKYEEIREREINKIKNKYDKKTLKSIDEITKKIIKKIASIPLNNIKENSQITMDNLPVIKEIFKINKENKK